MVAKAKTGAKAPKETEIAKDIKATQVEKPQRDLRFLDYRKCRDVILEGRFVIRGILVGKDKQRHWMLISADSNKIVGYFGNRKDGKGVYGRSEIFQICSEITEKKEPAEAVKV